MRDGLSRLLLLFVTMAGAFALTLKLLGSLATGTLAQNDQGPAADAGAQGESLDSSRRATATVRPVTRPRDGAGVLARATVSRLTSQESAMLANPLEFIELRNVMLLQVEDEIGSKLRTCAAVTARTFCRVTFSVFVAEGLVHTLGVKLQSCRALETERARIEECFATHLRELGDVALPSGSVHLADYEGDVNLDLDWDETTPTD